MPSADLFKIHYYNYTEVDGSYLESDDEDNAEFDWDDFPVRSPSPAVEEEEYEDGGAEEDERHDEDTSE